MNLIVKILQVLGFWSEPSHSYNSRRAIFLIFAVAVWIVIPEISILVRKEHDIASALRCLIEVSLLSFVIPQAVIFMIHRRLLERTFGEINSALLEASTDPHWDVQNLLHHLELFAAWLLKGYIGSEIVIACLYLLSIPVIILVQYVDTGVLPPLRSIFEADYIIFDYRYNLLLWLATVAVTFVVSLHLVVFLIATHTFFWCLLHNVSGLFKIVRMKIERLDSFVGNAFRREELVAIVQLQETAYRSARAMEKALNVLMLLLYGVCAIEICMAMTALTLPSEDRDLLLKMVLVLIYTFFHIFIYSLLGTELISASTLTAEAFYATRWYMQTVSDQHNLLLALTRSQQMAALTTGKFFQINRITFGMTLKTAMQFFTVLRQVYGSQ